MVDKMKKELDGLKQIEDYEINSRTLFLEPVVYGSKIYSRIVELEDEFLSPFKPLDIIKKSCSYFGVDYESRKRGTRQLIGYSRKLPIIIEPIYHIYFYPTVSPLIPTCIWISFEHVESYRRVAAQKTMIIFRNKQSHIFPVPVSTIEGQMLRTSLLKSKLLQRIESNGRRLFYLPHGPQPLNALETSFEYNSRMKDPK
ncbi:competence protein ComK [Neobacillus drentensis]|uniref:competence protein ComK n=1 Tax=Neobacillus drentensis TaxID=220684 RepID=UPI0030032DE6